MPKESNKITFEKWLLKQKRRNDPIGDLARDFFFIREVSFLKSVKLNDDLLVKLGAPIKLHAALMEAKEYYNTHFPENDQSFK
jgi:hypothetical protein